MDKTLWSSAITYARQHYIKLALWLLVIIPLVPFVILNVALVVTVLAHGLHATPAQWGLPLQRLIKQTQPQRQVIALDWSAYANDAFRCSVDGKRIGRKLGTQLATRDISSLHLIGHSCGSFVILGISHFGQCANFSEAYIDTRDGVPGSNQALEHAYTFDVSQRSGRLSRIATSMASAVLS